MPVIALILSTLAFWLIYWFIRMGGLDHVHSVFARRREDARRAQARERERTGGLRAVDDPREAATILMLLMARVGGDPTREHILAIERLIRVAFGLDRELAEWMTAARFIASRAESFEEAAGLFSDLFNTRLTAGEKRELVAMLAEVASVEEPSAAHNEALDVIERRVGLAPPR
jgi:uncharacterized tellurite resistance protein B-like protein